jgi:hypothetical protein
MNILLVAFLFSVVLLALDLLTAPKHPDSSPGTNLKESRRAAEWALASKCCRARRCRRLSIGTFFRRPNVFARCCRAASCSNDPFGENRLTFGPRTPDN